MIKQNFEKNKTVKTVKGDFSLSVTINLQILPQERKLGTKNVHLIVEEYALHDLSIEEANSLCQIFSEEQDFINSTVFIAAQPIEINRVDSFYRDGIKRRFSQKEHKFDKLIQIIGMKKKILRNVMRTTVEINTLAEITQEYLDNQSNKYVPFQSAFRYRSHNTFFKLPQNSSSKLTSDDSSNPATSDPHVQKLNYRAFQWHRLIPTVRKATNLEGTGSYQETVTEYRYTCESQIGHGIKGPLPQLIKLSFSLSEFQQIALIASILEKVIPAERTAVIHFEDDDPPFWLKSLFQLTKRFKMTINTEEFLTDANKNLVLVKNLNFIKGLEFSNVLLILDTNEHHQRQYIPEAIARCKSNLSILIKPVPYYKTDTVADLIDEWEMHNLIKPIVDVLEIGFCDKTSCNKIKSHQSVYCVDEKYSSYKVHENNRLYRNILTEIKRTYDHGIKQNYAKRSAEAKAL